MTPADVTRRVLLEVGTLAVIKLVGQAAARTVRAVPVELAPGDREQGRPLCGDRITAMDEKDRGSLSSLQDVDGERWLPQLQEVRPGRDLVLRQQPVLGLLERVDLGARDERDDGISCGIEWV